MAAVQAILSSHTDTAAALRAVEINADAVMKGTRVDGIYDSDPEKNANALRIPEISYMDVLKKGLRVMDLTAITLCQENKLPIIVFNMNQPGNLRASADAGRRRKSGQLIFEFDSLLMC